jgi:hypothetical protein
MSPQIFGKGRRVKRFVWIHGRKNERVPKEGR